MNYLRCHPSKDWLRADLACEACSALLLLHSTDMDWYTALHRLRRIASIWYVGICLQKTSA